MSKNIQSSILIETADDFIKFLEKIDDEEYIVVKYILKSSKGEPYVTLASENPDFAPRDIDFRSVNAIALVKASIRFNCLR